MSALIPEKIQNSYCQLVNNRQFIPDLLSNSIDVVFTDPPFNLLNFDLDKVTSDDAYFDPHYYLPQFKRILKHKTGTLILHGNFEFLAPVYTLATSKYGYFLYTKVLTFRYHFWSRGY